MLNGSYEKGLNLEVGLESLKRLAVITCAPQAIKKECLKIYELISETLKPHGKKICDTDKNVNLTADEKILIIKNITSLLLKISTLLTSEVRRNVVTSLTLLQTQVKNILIVFAEN